MKNFLGLDWGKEKIGVALAHAETRIALPFRVVPNSPAGERELLQIMDEENVGLLVVGDSRRRGATAVPSASAIWARELARKAGREMVLVDEMFTSKLAQDMLLERGETAVAKQDDAEAAKILLQDWLDQETPS